MQEGGPNDQLIRRILATILVTQKAVVRNIDTPYMDDTVPVTGVNRSICEERKE
jgi:hypothetical protein